MGLCSSSLYLTPNTALGTWQVLSKYMLNLNLQRKSPLFLHAVLSLMGTMPVWLGLSMQFNLKTKTTPSAGFETV